MYEGHEREHWVFMCWSAHQACIMAHQMNQKIRTLASSSNSALAPPSQPSAMFLAPLGPGRIILIVPPFLLPIPAATTAIPAVAITAIPATAIPTATTTTIPAIVDRSFNSVFDTISRDNAGLSLAIATTMKIALLILVVIALPERHQFNATALAVASPSL